MTGEVTCPWCDCAWTSRAWVTGPGFEVGYPALTVCFRCAEVTHVDRGPFGFMIRRATPAEVADPEVAAMQEAVRSRTTGD